MPKVHGKMECSCPTCQPSYVFVCGSDDRTYASLCHLKRFSCLSNRNITVKARKACGKCNCFHISLCFSSYFE